jgi:hypothetical protein
MELIGRRVMQIGCPHCGHRLSYSDTAPRFCSNCGRPMGVAAPAVDLETATTPGLDPFATLAAVPGRDTHADGPLVLGGYRVLRFVGGGGMGSVHEAEEEATGRRVALKVIRAEFSDSPDALDRFRREGRLAATIQHPRCVFVLGADEDAGRPYIVMELMPGQNLQDRVEAAGPMGIPEAVRHILDTIEGLEEAHRCGVIHRDVKPSNCFLDADGRVKVGDFGLAKSLIADQALTRSGAFLGTLLFASPEQIRNDNVDHSTDIYSACATLYFLLTGRAPFHDGDAASTLARTVTEPAPSMRKLRPELPRTLDEVVLRGLERSRKKRWQGLDDLRLALLPFVEPEQCVAGLGWRVCAYLIDTVGRTPLKVVASVAVAGLIDPGWVGGIATDSGARSAAALVGSILLSLLCGLLYFAVPETLWGCSPGKYLMRLRVREVATGDRPRWWRSGLRTLSFYLVKDGLGLIAGLVLLGTMSRLSPADDQGLTARVTMVGVLLGVVPVLSGTIGLLLLASTMRRRNGLRALHEWLSGTWLIRLPETRPRFRAGASTWPKEGPLPDGIPRRVGGLRVCALVGEGGDGRVFHAEEETLGRPVWLWLRDAGSGPSRERRENARPGRSRWLAGGVADGRRWDAFIAAPGQPLPAVVDPRRPLGWRETLAILEQLTEELLAASHDGTLPGRAGPQQVWLMASGQVVLLDAPLTGRALLDSPLDLLRQVAATALEGAPRAPEDLRRPIQAPVPRAASHFLTRLVEEDHSLEQVCMAIQEVREEPAEIPRPARALQVAANAALALPGLACLFALGPILLMLAFSACFYAQARLEYDIAENEAAGASAELDLALLPGVAGKLTAAGRHAAGRAENRELWAKLREIQLERENILGGWDWLLDDTFAQAEREMQEGFFGTNDLVERRDLDKRRRELDELAEFDELFARGASGLARSWLDEWPFVLLVLTGWPLLWATWAGLTRGGVVPCLMGIALVDRRGRPAPRWRCFLRELFVWLPVVLLLAGSLFLDLFRLADGNGWDQDHLAYAGWASFVLWWLALLLLPFMAFRAVRGPRRALPDRLAGLYLVPG